MDKEFAQLKAILSNTETKYFNHKDFVTGRLGEKEIILQQCGIGKVNSAIGAVEMINHTTPTLLSQSGCAGGADTSLEVTDVVVATECAYHDAYCGDEVAYGQIIGMPARFKAPTELIEKALSLNNLPDCKDLHVKAGLTVSGEWLSTHVRRCNRSWTTSQRQQLSTWRVVLLRRSATSIKPPSSPSVSSAIFRSKTTKPASTTTSGSASPTAALR